MSRQQLLDAQLSDDKCNQVRQSLNSANLAGSGAANRNYEGYIEAEDGLLLRHIPSADADSVGKSDERQRTTPRAHLTLNSSVFLRSRFCLGAAQEPNSLNLLTPEGAIIACGLTRWLHVALTSTKSTLAPSLCPVGKSDERQRTTPRAHLTLNSSVFLRSRFCLGAAQEPNSLNLLTPEGAIIACGLTHWLHVALTSTKIILAPSLCPVGKSDERQRTTPPAHLTLNSSVFLRSRFCLGAAQEPNSLNLLTPEGAIIACGLTRWLHVALTSTKIILAPSLCPVGKSDERQRTTPRAHLTLNSSVFLRSRFCLGAAQEPNSLNLLTPEGAIIACGLTRWLHVALTSTKIILAPSLCPVGKSDERQRTTPRAHLTLNSSVFLRSRFCLGAAQEPNSLNLLTPEGAIIACGLTRWLHVALTSTKIILAPSLCPVGKSDERQRTTPRAHLTLNSSVFLRSRFCLGAAQEPNSLNLLTPEGAIIACGLTRWLHVALTSTKIILAPSLCPVGKSDERQRTTPRAHLTLNSSVFLRSRFCLGAAQEPNSLNLPTPEGAIIACGLTRWLHVALTSTKIILAPSLCPVGKSDERQRTTPRAHLTLNSSVFLRSRFCLGAAQEPNSLNLPTPEGAIIACGLTRWLHVVLTSTKSTLAPSLCPVGKSDERQRTTPRAHLTLNSSVFLRSRFCLGAAQEPNSLNLPTPEGAIIACGLTRWLHVVLTSTKSTLAPSLCPVGKSDERQRTTPRAHLTLNSSVFLRSRFCLGAAQEPNSLNLPTPEGAIIACGLTRWLHVVLTSTKSILAPSLCPVGKSDERQRTTPRAHLTLNSSVFLRSRFCLGAAQEPNSLNLLTPEGAIIACGLTRWLHVALTSTKIILAPSLCPVGKSDERQRTTPRAHLTLNSSVFLRSRFCLGAAQEPNSLNLPTPEGAIIACGLTRWLHVALTSTKIILAPSLCPVGKSDERQRTTPRAHLTLNSSVFLRSRFCLGAAQEPNSLNLPTPEGAIIACGLTRWLHVALTSTKIILAPSLCPVGKSDERQRTTPRAHLTLNSSVFLRSRFCLGAAQEPNSLNLLTPEGAIIACGLTRWLHVVLTSTKSILAPSLCPVGKSDERQRTTPRAHLTLNSSVFLRSRFCLGAAQEPNSLNLPTPEGAIIACGLTRWLHVALTSTKIILAPSLCPVGKSDERQRTTPRAHLTLNSSVFLRSRFCLGAAQEPNSLNLLTPEGAIIACGLTRWLHVVLTSTKIILAPSLCPVGKSDERQRTTPRAHLTLNSSVFLRSRFCLGAAQEPNSLNLLTPEGAIIACGLTRWLHVALTSTKIILAPSLCPVGKSDERQRTTPRAHLTLNSSVFLRSRFCLGAAQEPNSLNLPTPEGAIIACGLTRWLHVALTSTKSTLAPSLCPVGKSDERQRTTPRAHLTLNSSVFLRSRFCLGAEQEPNSLNLPTPEGAIIACGLTRWLHVVLTSTKSILAPSLCPVGKSDERQRTTPRAHLTLNSSVFLRSRFCLGAAQEPNSLNLLTPEGAIIACGLTRWLHVALTSTKIILAPSLCPVGKSDERQRTTPRAHLTLNSSVFLRSRFCLGAAQEPNSLNLLTPEGAIIACGLTRWLHVALTSTKIILAPSLCPVGKSDERQRTTPRAHLTLNSSVFLRSRFCLGAAQEPNSLNLPTPEGAIIACGLTRWLHVALTSTKIILAPSLCPVGKSDERQRTTPRAHLTLNSSVFLRSRFCLGAAQEPNSLNLPTPEGAIIACGLTRWLHVALTSTKIILAPSLCPVGKSDERQRTTPRAHLTLNSSVFLRSRFCLGAAQEPNSLNLPTPEGAIIACGLTRWLHVALTSTKSILAPSLCPVGKSDERQRTTPRAHLTLNSSVFLRSRFCLGAAQEPNSLNLPTPEGAIIACGLTRWLHVALTSTKIILAPSLCPVGKSDERQRTTPRAHLTLNSSVFLRSRFCLGAAQEPNSLNLPTPEGAIIACGLTRWLHVALTSTKIILAPSLCPVGKSDERQRTTPRAHLTLNSSVFLRSRFCLGAAQEPNSLNLPTPEGAIIACGLTRWLHVALTSTKIILAPSLCPVGKSDERQRTTPRAHLTLNSSVFLRSRFCLGAAQEPNSLNLPTPEGAIIACGLTRWLHVALTSTKIILAPSLCPVGKSDERQRTTPRAHLTLNSSVFLRSRFCLGAAQEPNSLNLPTPEGAIIACGLTRWLHVALTSTKIILAPSLCPVGKSDERQRTTPRAHLTLNSSVFLRSRFCLGAAQEPNSLNLPTPEGAIIACGLTRWLHVALTSTKSILAPSLCPVGKSDERQRTTPRAHLTLNSSVFLRSRFCLGAEQEPNSLNLPTPEGAIIACGLTRCLHVALTSTKIILAPSLCPVGKSDERQRTTPRAHLTLNSSVFLRSRFCLGAAQEPNSLNLPTPEGAIIACGLTRWLHVALTSTKIILAPSLCPVGKSDERQRTTPRAHLTLNSSVFLRSRFCLGAAQEPNSWNLLTPEGAIIACGLTRWLHVALTSTKIILAPSLCPVGKSDERQRTTPRAHLTLNSSVFLRSRFCLGAAQEPNSWNLLTPEGAIIACGRTRWLHVVLTSTKSILAPSLCPVGKSDERQRTTPRAHLTLNSSVFLRSRFCLGAAQEPNSLNLLTPEGAIIACGLTRWLHVALTSTKIILAPSLCPVGKSDERQRTTPRAHLS
ncbi:hypothetical protein V5799_019015 [Amblyomma americanum]|uniref:Uncharacterized protein n=1 Tax=Amblyomma americanum TaxID=6943 RepID=A0AAQ4EYX7_AMBAM